jgi:hypothetical protein
MKLRDSIREKTYSPGQPLPFTHFGVDIGEMNPRIPYLPKMINNMFVFNEIDTAQGYAEQVLGYEEGYLWGFDGNVWVHLDFIPENGETDFSGKLRGFC